VAAEESEADFNKSVYAYTKTCIALFDGFISCWDAKYKTALVRPETLINRHIDPDWLPVLQTPPFPEYTSGHSVISTAAAAALTDVFGEDFAFDDTTEEEFGLPTRSFNSFKEAANEAAMSRLYGGIHYRAAIEHGVTQGEAVGDLINNRLDMRVSSNEIMQAQN
nr:vanadium-dependent haloperoxidase [Saprospiraceae bacterium]